MIQQIPCYRGLTVTGYGDTLRPMVGKTAKQRMAEMRSRKVKGGLTRFEDWLTKRELKAVRLLLKDLRAPDNQS